MILPSLSNLPIEFTMKYLPFAALLATPFVTALTIASPDQAVLRPSSESEEEYLIELGPEDTRWVVEEEKWELRRVCLSVSSQASFLRS